MSEDTVLEKKFLRITSIRNSSNAFQMKLKENDIIFSLDGELVNKTYDDFLEENGIRRVELKNGGGLGLKFSKDTLIDFIKGEFPRDYIRLEKRLKIMSPEDVEQQLDYLRETKRNN